MNKRIKELITQNGGYWNHGDFGLGSSVEFQEKDMELFIASIVKETLQVARAGMEYGPNMDEVVYNYYGIKE